MKKLILAATTSVVALAWTACDRSADGWSLRGTVAGAGDTTLTIQGFNNGHWYVVDSVKTSDGEFAYRAAAPAPYPEIMRLALGDQYIYFPVDSVDRLDLSAYASHFNTGYSLSGTLQAGSITSLDSIITASVASRGAAATAADPQLKKELFGKAFADPSIVSVYYLINKSVGDKPLFDINNPADLRLFGAVAQRFATERPDDPRGEYLAAVYKNARAASLGFSREIQAAETGLFDIVRSDSRGASHSLADVASRGGVTVLSFTTYGKEFSPAYNVILNKIYEQHHPNGLEIYQIAFDNDETAWKQTARNLPWIAVWNSTTDSSEPLIKYNVGALPMTFIIDRQGNIAARVSDPEKLPAEVAKYM